LRDETETTGQPRDFYLKLISLRFLRLQIIYNMSGRRFVRQREVFCSTAQPAAFPPWLLIRSLISAAEIGD